MDKHIIRENAGKLWRLLSTDVHRKWNLQEVKELTGFNDLEVASAIGWLAREDKIQFELEHHDTKDKNALLYLMLNVYFPIDRFGEPSGKPNDFHRSEQSEKEYPE